MTSSAPSLTRALTSYSRHLLALHSSSLLFLKYNMLLGSAKIFYMGSLRLKHSSILSLGFCTYYPTQLPRLCPTRESLYCMCKADEGLFFVVSQSALYHSAIMLNTLASHFALHFKALVPCLVPSSLSFTGPYISVG